MKITGFRLLSTEQTLAKLRKTPLRGFDGVKIYENADLILERQFDTDLLVPPQHYVLSPQINTLMELEKSFGRFGVDIFNLDGALLFWTDSMEVDDPPIPFLPPVVEESQEKDGSTVLLVNDGMHRVWTARQLGRKLNIICARNLPKEYPYYAYAMMEGWGSVREFIELPDEFLKKDYRDPTNYKALFRQFNVVFPGIQEQRKQSNPAGIKA